MSNKSKPVARTMRISEEHAEKFKEITQDLGINQDQALAKLMEVYELELGRASMPELRENIDTFEGYSRILISMYTQALESTQNMRSLVRTEFETQLKTKDGLLAEMRERLLEAEKIAEGFSEKENEYTEKLSNLNTYLEETEKNLVEKQLEYQNSISSMQIKYEALEISYTKLQNQESETKEVLRDFMTENKELKEECNNLREKARELDVAIFNQGRENVQLEQELEQVKEALRNERTSRADEFGQYRKNIELQHRLELTELESSLNAQHRTELDELRKELDKYKDLYYQEKK